LGNGGTSGSVVGNITDNGALAFNRSDTVSFTAMISGSGTVAQNGSGMVVLTAANTYSGGTTVNAGTLVVQNFGLPATSIVVNSDGTLQYDTSGGNINQLRSDLSDTGKLVKIGAGQLLFGNAGNNAINWNFSAGALIDVQGGTLVGGTSINDFWTNDNASLNIAAGATFAGVEANVQIDALTGTGSFTGGYFFGGRETVGIAYGSGTFSGSLKDTDTGSGLFLSLVKVGTGIQTLSGVNTYSGSTMVNNGTLTTTSTGTLGNGPLAVNAATAITSIVNLGNSQVVSALSGSIAGTGSARVSVAAGKTLTVNQSSNTIFAGTVALSNGATVGNGGALAKSNGGTLEIDGGLTLGSNSSLAVSGGRLRLSIASGSPSVGTGVTASVTGSAILELAGSVSALGTAIPADRVAITNNSIAVAGLLVSGGNQQVGNIDGSGNTQVNAGSDLTANHIVQAALVIGGTAGSPALITIATSDSSGNPLVQPSKFAVDGSLTPGSPFGAGDTSSTNLSSRGGTDLAAPSPSNSAVGGNPSPVPEHPHSCLCFSPCRVQSA
jgi:fibronectin-binding autotransporter adhesin